MQIFANGNIFVWLAEKFFFPINKLFNENIVFI